MSCVWEGRGAGSWFGEEVTKKSGAVYSENVPQRSHKEGKIVYACNEGV